MHKRNRGQQRKRGNSGKSHSEESLTMYTIVIKRCALEPHPCYLQTWQLMAKKQSQFMDCFLPELEETGRVLGRGAYGEVVEMLLHGTKVAGKKIHNVFFDSTNDPSHVESMRKRFEQECVRYVRLIVHISFCSYHASFKLKKNA